MANVGPHKLPRIVCILIGFGVISYKVKVDPTEDLRYCDGYVSAVFGWSVG